MSRDSRLFYHAVPKILKSGKEELLQKTGFRPKFASSHGDSVSVSCDRSEVDHTSAKRAKLQDKYDKSNDDDGISAARVSCNAKNLGIP